MSRRLEDWPRPAVTVDLVLLTDEPTPRVLLIERAHDPCAGQWALPGGFVDVGDVFTDQGEGLETAARRELAEETGLASGLLDAHGVRLEQLGAWGKPGRDPRQRTITIAYVGQVPAALLAHTEAGDDAAQARWWPVDEIDWDNLAFDHASILDAGLRRLR